MCKIVDMDACHLLLGRPWQFDVNTTHRGRDNSYVIELCDKQIMLMPLEEPLVSQTFFLTISGSKITKSVIFEDIIIGFPA